MSLDKRANEGFPNANAGHQKAMALCGRFATHLAYHGGDARSLPILSNLIFGTHNGRNSNDKPYGHRAARVGSINSNGRIARTAAARRTQCRVDTRPGQCGASNLQGGNHTYPYSETIRDLPVRCAQGAGVRISKVWKRQIISRLLETGCRTDASSRSRLPACLRWGMLL